MADGRNRLLSIAQAAMLCNPAPWRVLFSNKKRRATRRKLSKNPLGRCRRGRGLSDFRSYPGALPTGRFIPYQSGENHFCPTRRRVPRRWLYARPRIRFARKMHTQAPPTATINPHQENAVTVPNPSQDARKPPTAAPAMPNSRLPNRPTRRFTPITRVASQPGQRAKGQPKKQRHENPPPLPFILRWQMAIHAPVFLSPRGLKAEEFSYFTDRAAQGAKGISMLEGHCVGCKTVQKAWKMV